MADDGQHLAGMRAHAVEHFRMADDLKTVVRLGALVEAGKDLKEARDGAQPGDDQLLAGNDGASGAQIGIDGEMGGGVADSLVFYQGLLQQCVDAVALPVHKTVVSCQFIVLS